MRKILPWHTDNYWPLWLRRSEHAGFVREFCEEAPERLNPRMPWPEEYMSLDLFPALRMARHQLQWLRQANSDVEEQRFRAEEWSDRNKSTREHASLEMYRMEDVASMSRGLTARLGRYCTGLEWLCRAEAELEYARRLAADADVADREEAEAWAEYCERYYRVLLASWDLRIPGEL